MITRKAAIYISIVSLLLLPIQPALAQTYYFGPSGSGITWSDIWKFGRNPSVIGAPSTPFGAAAGSIMRSMAEERATVIIGKKKLTPVEQEKILESIKSATKEGLEKAGVQATKAVTKNIKIGAAKKITPTLLKSLGIVTIVEAVAEYSLASRY